MIEKDPPRLIDDPELGASLRAARDEAMPPERLAANGRALDARLTKLSPLARLPPGTGVSLVVTLAALAVFVRLVAGPALTPVRPERAERVEGPVETASIAVDTTPSAAPSLASIATPVPAPSPEATRVVVAPTPSPVVGGTLADELRLYDEARAFVRTGEHAAALHSLDELARRFPKTSLAPEAAITRAEVLVAAGRLDDASALLSRLVGEPAHAGRRAELLRTLGDVERSRGDCASARRHYRAALDAGATGEEASAVRRGLGACEAGE